MARVTVEDCVLKVPNRFELVLLSSQRAREIGAGAAMMVERDNDKNPVIALREIADTEISLENLGESLIKNHQKVIEVEEDEEDIIDVMEGESEWAHVAGASAEGEVADAGMQASDATDAEDSVVEEEAEEEAPAMGAAFDAGDAGEDDKGF